MSEEKSVNTAEKVAEEVALQEFERFADCMDLDIDIDAMDAEDLEAFNGQKRRIIRAIRNGNLIVNENGEAVYTPFRPNSKYKEAITFKERSGASLIAMDSKKKGQEVSKTYAIMADMCGIPQSVFSGLVGTDIKVCEAVFALLMD